MPKNTNTCPEYIPVETVRSLFVSGEELGLSDPRHDALEQTFNAVGETLIKLKDQFVAAKSARGETVTNGANGLMWQRNRAFLVATVKLDHIRTTMERQLTDLLAADKNIRDEALAATQNRKWQIIIASNLRCSYEIHEEAANLYSETELFLAEVDAAAWKNGAEGIEYLRHVPPGFNRDWVLKVCNLDGDGQIKYTLGRTLSELPPAIMRLSNFDIEAAIRLVGEREFKNSCGWVAVYRPERDHTGPKHLFKNGALMQTTA